MSAVRKPGGEWLTQNYDKLILSLVLAFLLLSALLLLLRTGQSRQGAGADPGMQPGWVGKDAEAVDLSPLTQLLADLSTPFQVGVAQRRMMVGELRVASVPDGAPIAYNAATDPFSGAPQPSVDFDPDSDGDGLSDKVEYAHGLNPADSSDATADLDGDGYTNIEEIQMGTDLRDAASYPPPVAKLRLVRTVVKPFRFRFLGVSRLPDGDRYQLNLRSLERTYFARMGDEIEGYKIRSYEEKTPEGPVLTLAQGETVMRLIQGKVINQDARTADMVLLLDASRYRRQIGDTLKLKDLVYNVVDIKADRVVLRDVRDAKESVVSLLSLEERARLVNESSPAASGGGESPGGAVPPDMMKQLFEN